jgi:AmmeMemoRadiSam system protein B
MGALIRKAAVAGYFYPSDPKELRDTVWGMLMEADLGPVSKALIAPHAGHAYSGPIAATAYVRIPQGVKRVVLLGPAHRHPCRGLASHGADAFETPLGRVPLDREAIDDLEARGLVQRNDAAHAEEHSLEVHLPFLQVVLRDFTLVPLVVGDASTQQVAEVLEAVWGGRETVVVISSDLSHFKPYDEACRTDQATAAAIERLEEVGPYEACGCRPIAGLQEVARKKSLSIELLDLRNSGDTAGSRGEVVGYGSFAVSDPE